MALAMDLLVSGLAQVEVPLVVLLEAMEPLVLEDQDLVLGVLDQVLEERVPELEPETTKVEPEVTKVEPEVTKQEAGATPLTLTPKSSD